MRNNIRNDNFPYMCYSLNLVLVTENCKVGRGLIHESEGRGLMNRIFFDQTGGASTVKREELINKEHYS